VRPALALGARVGQTADLLRASSEPVAGALELPERQQRGTARAGGPLAGGGGALAAGGGGDEGESLGDDPRQLALEARDLRSQRRPRGALAGGILAGLGAALEDQLIKLGQSRLLLGLPEA
jgi:hypothetical protein